MHMTDQNPLGLLKKTVTRLRTVSNQQNCLTNTIQEEL